MIYKQGDEIATLFIVTSGQAAFVQPRYKNQIFSIIDPVYDQKEGKLLQYMGYEDSVINHLLLIKEISEKNISGATVERRADKSFLSRRKFNVQCLYNMECLCLAFTDIDIIKNDFRTSMIKFIE